MVVRDIIFSEQMHLFLCTLVVESKAYGLERSKLVVKGMCNWRELCLKVQEKVKMDLCMSYIFIFER
jgi:hypothetical protein